MKFSPVKIHAITSLSGKDRYSHFIKTAADLRSVWGLYEDGWALVHDSEGRPYFPIWPAEPYARQCALVEWKNYQPREIELEEFLKTVIPKLRESEIEIAIFPTPEERGVTPNPELLEKDLREELARIE